MDQRVSTLILMLVSGVSLAQTAPGIPEIDAASGTGALVLRAGAVALVSERRRKR